MTAPLEEVPAELLVVDTAPLEALLAVGPVDPLDPPALVDDAPVAVAGPPVEPPVFPEPHATRNTAVSPATPRAIRRCNRIGARTTSRVPYLASAASRDSASTSGETAISRPRLTGTRHGS